MKKPIIPDNENDRLQALRNLNILDTAPEKEFDRITRLAQKIFNTPIALVSLVDKNRQWFKSSQGLDTRETLRDISFCGHAILDDDVLVIPDALQDERFSDNPLVAENPNIRFYAGAPIKSSEGYNIGTLCVIDTNPRDMTSEDIENLQELSGCVERLLRCDTASNTNLLNKSKQLNDAIVRVQAEFIERIDRRDAFNVLLESILDITESEYGFIGEILHTEDNAPYLKTYAITNIAWNDETRAFYKAQAPQGMEFYNLNSLFGHAMANQSIVISNDPENDIRKCGIPDGHPDLNAFLGIPVFYHDEMIAMMGIANREGGYSEELVEFLKPLTVTMGQLVSAMRVRALQRQSEQEAIEARDEADKANQAKSMFLSSMSHELRTPLNAILGFAQILQLDSDLNEVQASNIDEIYRAGKHLLSLINEVLDLTRIESGNLELSLQAVDILPVVKESLNLLSVLADKNNITIESNITDSVFIMADKTRLKQALLNLCSNAIKYNRPSGSVTIACELADEMATIKVIDTGTGIEQKRLPEIFQPFNRLDADQSNVEGTGIGLPLTKQLVELMNGEIDVTSEHGQGSTFSIRFPLAQKS